MKKMIRKTIFVAAVLLLFLPAILSADAPLPAWYTTDWVSREFKIDFAGITDIYDRQSPAELQQRLRESREEWERQKKLHGNSYTYTRAFQSWVGFGHRTIITVTGGVVVERSYEEFDKHGKTTDSYTEQGKKIGSSRYGEPPLTVDALYDLCAGEILMQDPKNNVLNLELTADGLLESCTYRPKGCVDDCSEGITGFTLTWNE